MNTNRTIASAHHAARMVAGRLISTAYCAVLILLALAAQSQTQITLKNAFIEKYKHRATIDTTFTIDKALPQVHSAKSDGDIHIAGRAPEIGLASVAEIMNAAGEPASVDLVHQMEGHSLSIKMTGAWRLWCEHGGESAHVQGAPLEPFADSNPDHVFEVHPVTQIGLNSLLRSLHPIEGYKPKPADRAFPAYESVRCRIILHDQTTTLDTEMAGFNYVDFHLELLSDTQFRVEDGTMAFASVLDDDGEMLIRKRRMVFIKDSIPEQKLKTLKKGDVMHVLGIPRISLALLSWRIKNARTKPEILTWNLPYEMIIVGLFDD